VLVRKAADFELIETMRWEAGRGCWFLREHLDRLQESAGYCGFRFDRAQVERELEVATGGITKETARVRLSLDERGQMSIQIDELIQANDPLRVAVDDVPVDPSDWRLFHKTSMRRRYRQARLRHPDADDVLMINGAGEITESTIANVIVRLDGRWVTPPLASGCLPGVMRRVLLEAGDITEAPVLVSDLTRAEGLELINSVRLRVPAMLTGPIAVPAPGR
jgi:para-aminobenzoate synthetase/4-amino-4-deoxychorismate lyase